MQPDYPVGTIGGYDFFLFFGSCLFTFKIKVLLLISEKKLILSILRYKNLHFVSFFVAFIFIFYTFPTIWPIWSFRVNAFLPSKQILQQYIYYHVSRKFGNCTDLSGESMTTE